MKRSSSTFALAVFGFAWLALTGNALGRVITSPSPAFISGGGLQAVIRNHGRAGSVSRPLVDERMPLMMADSGDNNAFKGAQDALKAFIPILAGGMMLPTQPQAASADELLRSYSQFLDKVEQKQIESVLFSADGRSLTAIDTEGERYLLEGIPNDPDLLKTLRDNKVEFAVRPVQQTPNLLGFIANLLPWLLLGSLFFLGSRGGMGGPGGPGGNPLGGFGRSQAKIDMNPNTGVTFDQVAGQDEAKTELGEVVTFLKNPQQFTKLGAKIPKGVIMEGPPGTGKTLMAKAVAGEAGVPFFSQSGSNFVEVFVGIGASRVRDLFEKAKKVAPCIIFIDEIDSIGRARSSGGFMPQNDEREQTLNQLLAEMDGFSGNQGVVVIAATNRADILDEALLRPGRFDRRVAINLPDLPARRAILDVYVKGKPIGDVDLDAVARRTTGFSGASLENLMNEAAIFAARKGKEKIDTEDIDAALDRIMLGSEKTNRLQSDRVKTLTAYHEAGHALVGAFLPGYDAVQKISIIPRTGGAGGATFYLPSEERLTSGMYSVDYLQNQLAVALGGRAAEEVVYGREHVTTGASNDLQQVTRIARSMVTQYGMNDKVGQLNVEDAMMRQGTAPFLETSQRTKEAVDDEVRELVNSAYEKAKRLLQDNRSLLDEVSRRLVEEEIMNGEDFMRIVSGYGAGEKEAKPTKELVAA
ncbi:unnamed protein product [Vitrella brassicaformis CCMP3155]|uniref:AAA+ ATPase domain-containing protein n=1 Tax=Vitrella brassicaformis (strain CCMP3155) TaxID=1169540 RepID=A0A0G4F8Q5_VITBC|nr:unnamed protein product [Vitrella brassicaformis CCMP3155]|mmetsp:Transcript_31725/g.78612  ORF Transcript_31725/g.78612 Transcript_31725/m.78612 type:complete len:698 (-) Transcript_31725:860-2953(-)|eukprot:CEM09133.1 unnamed protein product [Vitrella brassicaformis CCMP3155]